MAGTARGNGARLRSPEERSSRVSRALAPSLPTAQPAPEARRCADRTTEIRGYLAATRSVTSPALRQHQAWLARDEGPLATAVVLEEARDWLSGYVFGVVYRRRNRWWWQRLASRDVPPDMSRAAFVLQGVGQIGTGRSRRRVQSGA
jgi:hypothetical protein